MLRSVALLVLAAALASPAGGQAIHTFAIDSLASGFTFGGNVQVPPSPSLPIQGTPGNFNLVGTLDLRIVESGGAVTAAQFVPGGSATTFPAISGQVPNPLPFLPPVATFTINGLQIAMRSVDPVSLTPKSFPVVGGSFTADVVVETLAGGVSFNVAGTPNFMDLTGSQSPPQTLSGTLTKVSSGFRLAIPVAIGFNFSDPASGASGFLSLNGGTLASYRPLNSDVDGVSVGFGGAQTLYLSSAGTLPGKPYLVAGTASGTTPGFALDGMNVPLNFDSFLAFSVDNANVPPFGNTLGFLSPVGKATATVTVPPNSNPALVGQQLHFAYLVVDLGGTGTVGFVSNAEPLQLLP